MADLLKGPRGTVVKVTVVRQGHEQPLSFDVMRDEISRKSVQDAFFLRPGIAYVQIVQFNETTSRELDDEPEAPGRAEHQGPDSRPARQSRRAAERRRGGGRTLPAKGTD